MGRNRINFVLLLTLAPIFLQLEVIGLNPEYVKLDQTENGFKLDVVTGGRVIEASLYQPSIQQKGLGSDFHFVVADTDDNGLPTFERWVPSKENLEQASKQLYVDPVAKAAFNIVPNGDSHKINGVLDGLRVKGTGVEYQVVGPAPNANDFLRVPENLTNYDQSSIAADEVPEGIVEYVIVADFEFCKLFEHNYQKILEYFIITMWDVNMRFKTLPSAKLSWQLNGIMVVANPEAQPFIENSRAGDGRVNHNRVLDAFSKWLFSNKEKLPHFDLSSVVTNAAQEWHGGLAYVGAACIWGGDRFWGASVWNDPGDWSYTGIAAHELGHNLGAGHDGDDCPDGGTFIMGGSSNAHRFFFSSCSDSQISNFVRAEHANCLRTLTMKNPAASPDFETPEAPSFLDQCRRRVKNSGAWVTNEACLSTTCNWRDDTLAPGWFWYSGFGPLDNSPCGTNGRCFRGKCREKGLLIKNAGSGLCMGASVFRRQSGVQMVTCPRVGTADTRFVIGEGTKGTYLATPYINMGNQTKESVDKCLWSGNYDRDPVMTNHCSNHSSSDASAYEGWDLVNVGRNEFLLKHRRSGRCAMTPNKNVGTTVVTRTACNRRSTYYRWTKY